MADAGRKNHNQGDDRAEQPRSPAPKTSQSGYGHKSSKDGRTAPQGAGQHKDKAKANNARQDERPELEDTAEPDGQFPDANTPGTWTPDGLGTGERRR